MSICIPRVSLLFCFNLFETSNQSSSYPAFCVSCPSASLDYIVEPWFLGPGSTSPGGPEFNEWAESSKNAYGTAFATSIKDLPAPKEPRCALISGRTADNPRLFGECIEAGCKTIFLEKPGAPTVRFLAMCFRPCEKIYFIEYFDFLPRSLNFKK